MSEDVRSAGAAAPVPGADTAQERPGGSDDAYFVNTRQEVHPLVPADARRVLEVGAGRLTFARWVLANRPVESYHYIEAFAETVEDDPRLQRVGYDAARWEPTEGAYDLVVALDVIEHVVEHLELLTRLVAALEHGGRLLLSIPNVAHYSILRRLLMGRFPYVDSGILDRTHVRFFTPASVREMCAEAGLELDRCLYKNRWGGSVRLLRTYRCYQYLSLWKKP